MKVTVEAQNTLRDLRDAFLYYILYFKCIVFIYYYSIYYIYIYITLYTFA